jgi:hypothetical protein
MLYVLLLRGLHIAVWPHALPDVAPRSSRGLAHHAIAQRSKKINAKTSESAARSYVLADIALSS